MQTTHTKRRASQFADELMPREIWFLAYTDNTEAAVFPSQADLIRFCDEHLTEDEILYAVSSILNIRTGVRVMVTHNAADVLDWIEDFRDEVEAERRFVQRDRMGVPA
jgi:hypothetical protein